MTNRYAAITLALLFSPGRLLAAGGESPGSESRLQLLQPPPPSAANAHPALPQSLHDIQGPIQLPEAPPFLLYAGIVLALAGILAALYWWFYLRAKPAPPPIPAGTIAREQLLAIRAMMNSSQALIYMERVSEILRLYIETRFQIRSTRKTTREFLTCLHLELPVGSLLAQFEPELQQCLEQCDLAKFAHQTATGENMQAMEDAVTRFIDQTAEGSHTPLGDGGT